jgi:two-component system phosphate regulon sensor histidine kinase PhoR
MMVEKLLETATLDSDNLELNKDDINLIDLINKVVGNQQVQDSAKTINFDSFIDNLIVHADAFHLENVINNVIDNALKYGGEIISIQIEENKGRIDISVSDTGNALTKQHKEKIFEQFYRVPKGNTHNVKGFGIGLYYTKKIIEKHGGTIQLELGKKRTTFKISLPNE